MSAKKGKTIKQIADELGVSKEAIRKHLDKLPPTSVTTGANRAILVKPRGEAVLLTLVSTRSTNVGAKVKVAPTNDTTLKLIDMLQRELDKKNKQLDVKDKQIDELNKRLAEAFTTIGHAQQLHGADKVIELTEGNKPGIITRLFRKGVKNG